MTEHQHSIEQRITSLRDERDHYSTLLRNLTPNSRNTSRRLRYGNRIQHLDAEIRTLNIRKRNT